MVIRLSRQRTCEGIAPYLSIQLTVGLYSAGEELVKIGRIRGGVDKTVSPCYDTNELNRDGTAIGSWVKDPRKAVTVIRAGGGADATG